MSDLLQTTPQMDWATPDIEPLVEELHADHTSSSPLFQRREQRDAAHTSRQGLLATWPRQPIEPMVLAVEGVAPKAVRAMPAFRSEEPWNDARRWHRHWQAVETDLGADDGVLRVDGSDVPQQGGHSVGVTRQDCGALGQRAHGQAGVLVGSVSSRGSTWRDRRVSVPAQWCTDEAYAERRRPCGLPPESTFTTKPELAQERLTVVVKSQVRRCPLGGGGRGVLGTIRAFWRAWWSWICGMLPKCPTIRGSGTSARRHASRRGVDAVGTHSRSAWSRGPPRHGRS